MIPKKGGEQYLVQIAGPEAGRLESLALVLSAVGIEHMLDERTHELLVADQDAESALFHLNEYRTENLDWPPPPPPRPIVHPQPPLTLLMMGLFALFSLHTGSWSTSSRWFARGAIDSIAILDHGEWWRLVTALTLHADLVHLLGNCLIGGAMIHFLSKTVGYGWAWLLLLLNGFTGNLLNILLRQHHHISVGFSTSVFAAIGIFTGLQLIRLKGNPVKGFILPLGAGAGLLAFLGSEGVQTDLGAHFFGFICGIISGILLCCTDVFAKKSNTSLQPLLFSISLAGFLFCWILALS